ncbi:MAG TPA: hypothetical protein EYQ86_03850 [Bacteroidetes bacterium]|nr:hypothetical protein [Bacteroidota bacterium]
MNTSIFSNKGVIFSFAITVFIFLEVEFLFFWKNIFGPFQTPLLLFFFSLASGICLMVLSLKGYSQEHKKPIITSLKQKILLWFIVCAGIGYFIFLSEPILSKYVINVYKLKYSDIIPQVSILAKRLLNAEFPYQTITDWKYNLFPTYLPLQWLPFTIAELFSFDYRWITITGFIISIVLFSSRVINANIIIIKKQFIIIPGPFPKLS